MSAKFEGQLKAVVEQYQEQRDINLYFSYYDDKNEARKAEIQLCVRLNALNRIFKRVFILNETDHELDFIEASPRVVVTHSPRLKFKEFFCYANQQTGEDDLNLLINTDVVIGDGFDTLSLPTPTSVICLSRYDLMEDGQYTVNVGGGSHDCWIWRGRLKETFGDFYMGIFLCDGVLANQFYENGYVLKNPMLDLKIYHVHLSGVRNYNIWVDKVLGQRRGIVHSHNDGVFEVAQMYDDGSNW